MKRAALLILLIVLTAGVARAQGPGPAALQPLLPHGARILASHKIPGYQRAYAVLFTTGKPFLAVTLRAKLLWTASVNGTATSIVTPGPTGLFAVAASSGQKGTVYAFRVSRSHVISGIEAVSTGRVSGDEGVSLSRTSFVVRAHDTSHKGSVRYRTAAHFALCATRYCLRTTTREPDYPSSQYPSPRAVVHTRSGDTILVHLEIAADQASQNQGLMNRKTLDPDSGMLFLWDHPVTESFWMQNTYIPLTVAFLASDGTIQETQDMQPLTETFHTPAKPYEYAIEVNRGFFAQNGVKVGDHVQLALTQ